MIKKVSYTATHRAEQAFVIANSSESKEERLRRLETLFQQHASDVPEHPPRLPWQGNWRRTPILP